MEKPLALSLLLHSAKTSCSPSSHLTLHHTLTHLPCFPPLVLICVAAVTIGVTAGEACISVVCDSSCQLGHAQSFCADPTLSSSCVDAQFQVDIEPLLKLIHQCQLLSGLTDMFL